MVSCAIINRIRHKGKPTDNTVTGAFMVACVSGNRSSRNVEPADNASGKRISHYSNPADNESTGAYKPNTVYVGKNQYPISIIQFPEVSDIAWRKKSDLVFLTYLVSYLSCGHNVSDLITLVVNVL